MTFVELAGLVAANVTSVAAAYGISRKSSATEKTARAAEVTATANKDAELSEDKTKLEVRKIEAQETFYRSMAESNAALVTDIAKERTELREERRDHTKTLRLVEGLKAHVEQTEVRLNAVEVAHADCTQNVADLKLKLERELAKRPVSNPGFPKATG